ncbi:1,4-alpha-glucan branching protein GlgB [Rhodobium gokarnense]|uniref:1,4-alpha-glucan branching enzyme GlgB n=1 Tax=Rhodobium gokarnense TaxID=364296 RepID=A0ABT3H7B1_9HYPH|nr:1,4-alpha-glucan branching protein GlgB [Rhodobium gokarnense]MCW2306276.1 1,4-alpha-glucan branching enzyme [Rhodobium gokarnense]
MTLNKAPGPGPTSAITVGEIAALLSADLADPFAVLGLHDADGGLVMRAYLPDADAVTVVDAASGEDVCDLDKAHDAGIFAGPVPGRTEWFPYRLAVTWGDWREEIEDPYRFPPVIGEMDEYLFSEGSHHRLYDRLGAHPTVHEGVWGTVFAVWAPNARRVSVVGDFNYWDGRRHMMRQRGRSGIYEIFVPGIGAGTTYKYEIKGPGGSILPLKADPVGFGAEHPPYTASIVREVGTRTWEDADWMESREARNSVTAPISIYEVHLGSWRKAGPESRFLTYRELADTLIPYAKDMGFTHLELLPVSEFPFDGSWGYQPVGLYAPTSRFGTLEDFEFFVETCHEAGLGLILDWVPGHFPADAHGLNQFDGTHLYDHMDPRRGFHPDWNTLIYNYGRPEVSNFLIANALYWLEQFHIDGLRVDAVASMLYLDYSRKEGEWLPNIYGGNHNLEAIDFLKRMNEVSYGRNPGIMTVAEESTSWSGVSRPTDGGGLGFGFKWNMGWMNDTLAYMGREPIHRRFHHNQMTFGMMYAYSENFVLPLSHDEVVHGKGSLIGRMPGDDWQKFANLRAYFGFMWTQPGKKLLFMGGEFAQWAEWNHNESLDWHLLEWAPHRGVQSLVRDLNRMYREHPTLHVRDCEPGGFEWLEANADAESIFAYLRLGNAGDRPVAVVSNFTPVPRENYRLGLPQPGRWREIMNTDAADYGGSGMGNQGAVVADDSVGWHNRPCSALITVPPLSTVIFELDG